ncbi:MAG: formate dehydrogenase subunit alpha [Pelagibacterales bacterium]|nr:formate dehydrogenase subunit alpha [Pelagibacterales bacterium]
MNNKKNIKFYLDDLEVIAFEDESIWEVSDRLGIRLPHLCHSAEPGYRSDGNCRACMVEIEGENVLAASCIRKPLEGMKVKTNTAKASNSRKSVFELLAADQPDRNMHPDPDSKFWKWTDDINIENNKFPKLKNVVVDNSHTAMHVNLDACINCNLCVRACREVQVNDVIGMSYRGHESKITFDFDDNMGDSTCVACGECVQSCPTGALIEKSLVNEEGVRDNYPDKTVNSLCPYCGVGCQTEVHVKDNKIIHVDGKNGPANNQRLCVKGRFGFDYINSDKRLLKPLIRKKDAPKDRHILNKDKNIKDYFREATWDEAIEISAKGFLDIFKENGSSSLCGFGSAKGSNEEAYLFQKLIRTAFVTNNVDHCTRLCHASSVAALLECVGSGAVSAPFTASDDSDCVIIIGARPTTNHPVAATYMKQASKNDTKLIIMDPRKNDMTRHAWKHLEFKPGMDVAMLNALIYTIIEEKLYDKQYVQSMTSGFEQLKESIKGFSPEEMSEKCGIPADTLREVARVYAKSDRSIIFWGMGISQHVHGTDNARCLITLSLITGQIGRPGTGLHPLRGQNNVQGASDAGLIPMVFPDYQPVENENIHKKMESFWGTKLDNKKGLTVVEILNEVVAGNIKGMYVMGENPAMSDPDQNHTLDGLVKLEHLVVQDIFMTETAWFADVILPASAHAEKTGTFTNTNRQVQMGRKVIECPGDAREDWKIINDLANALGLKWSYKHISEVFDEMSKIMPSLNNITWERLENEDSVTYPCDAEDSPGNDIIFIDGYPTEDNKGKIVPAQLISPAEIPDKEYPMILTTGRLLEHWHTGAMTRNSEVLDSLEPTPIISMNSRDMSKLGIDAGDMVKVSTRRGDLEVAVRKDWQLPMGMVFMPFCFSEAAANILTNPVLDPFGKIPEFKFCAAKIENAVSK